MQLIEGALGNADLVFAHDNTLRGTVALVRPVSRAHAFLRGFDVAYDGDDRNLKQLQITLDVAYADDASHVEVIARIVLQDVDPIGDLIHVAVFYTLLVD
jgi:hypothetical protein